MEMGRLQKRLPISSRKNEIRILLVYSNYSSFVKQDHLILNERYKVDNYQYVASKSLKIFIREFFRQLIFLLREGYKYDVFYCWFADYHSMLPNLFSRIYKKKSILVLGGFDAVSLPYLNFGLFYKKDLRNLFGRISYIFADYILPVDESLIKTNCTYADPLEVKVGFMHFFKKLKGKIITVPTGFDPLYWQRRDISNQRDIITMGGCYDMTDFLRKGHDLMIEVAKILPEYTFTLVGISPKLHLGIKNLPNNVKILGFVDHEELVDLFSAHKVVAQFSLSEGLPTTLCNAMLCGCIPVGSSVNGIPKAIGDTGFILMRKDINQAADIIKQAMNKVPNNSPRERIIQLFHLDHRKTKLFEIINN